MDSGTYGCSSATTAAESTITYYVRAGMDIGDFQASGSARRESALVSGSGADQPMVQKSNFLFRHTLLSNRTLSLGERIGLPGSIRLNLSHVRIPQNELDELL